MKGITKINTIFENVFNVYIFTILEISALILVLNAVYGLPTLQIGDLCDSVPIIRHPTDCNAYYECRMDRFELRHCPGLLHFNSQLRQCDHPANANCSVVQTNSCDSDFDLLPHADCTMYYSCALLQPREEVCFNELHWSVDRQMCMLPENARCVQGAAPFQPDAILINQTTTPRPTPEGPPTTVNPTPEDPNTTKAPLSTTTASPIKTCQTNFDFLPHPDCTMFYSCYGLLPREMLCSSGLHWNDAQGICTSPETAQCVEGSAPIQPDAIPITTTSLPQTPKPTPEGPHTTYAPISSTTTPIIPTPITTTTPTTMRPTHLTSTAATPSTTDLTTRLTSPPTTEETTISDRPTPPEPATTTLLPTPPTPTVLPTPPTPQITTATQPTTEAITEPTTTERGTPLPRNDCADVLHFPENVHLPHPNCTKFYQCHWGEPVERVCPLGLHFNAEISVCDFPVCANCIPGAAPEQRADILT